MAAILLKPLTLNAFLALLIKMKDGFKDELVDAKNVSAAILDRLDIDPTKFSKDALAKFELYCECFLEAIAD